MDPDLQEELAYLEEVLEEYARFVQNIGENGLSANLLLYYRDEVQDLLEALEGQADLQGYWSEVAALDDQVRKQAGAVVEEIGRENFRYCQIALDPPKLHWWWYLDRVVPPPRRPWLREFWEWLRR